MDYRCSSSGGCDTQLMEGITVLKLLLLIVTALVESGHTDVNILRFTVTLSKDLSNVHHNYTHISKTCLKTIMALGFLQFQRTTQTGTASFLHYVTNMG